MELTYRGVGYSYAPAATPVAPSAVEGNYRGLNWSLLPLVEGKGMPNVKTLYRGLAYPLETSNGILQIIPA